MPMSGHFGPAGLILELLLFLSALLTGLTGAISGERKAEPSQVARSAIEQAEIATVALAEAVSPSVRIAVPAVLAEQIQPLLRWSLQTAAIAPDVRLLSGKRQE